MTVPDAIEIDALIERALAEDVGTGDVTTLATIPADRRATATFLAKESGVLAGLAVTERVFAALDPEVVVRWNAEDGDAVEAGTRFGTAEGPARPILTGERLALNLMQRMSGIASATRQMADAARPHGATILDTRKTAPGLRTFDKWAVRIGGGTNHRTGLYDMFLIKDNHIAAAGGIRAAIEAARTYRAEHALALDIEIETRTLDEVDEALAVGGVDRVLLDNMVRVDGGTVDTTLLAEAVRRIGGRFETEASGNVTLATVPAIAAAGVEFISSGALTHSARALDLSLKIELR